MNQNEKAREKPQISVLVSCFGTEKYLKKFLEEMPRQQCFRRLQVVLNLNEPSAKEQQWAEDFIRLYPNRLKLIITNPVEPQSASWNKCIQESDGDYVAIWNVDDLRTPDSLLSQGKLLDQNKGVGAAHGNFVIVNEFGSKKGTLVDHSYTLNKTAELARSMCLGPFFMFRKELVGKIGFFDEQLRVAADFDFAIRLAKATNIGMAFGILGYFLDERKGLSTKGDLLQPIERTVVEMRYGLLDKIDQRFVPLVKEKKYDIENLFFGDQKINIKSIVGTQNE